ncbi:hypothetical protein RP20_CCG012124 [Aedes albopictus]|nr:hypothetical protein RP20_CCG012124 [Aedes albopictus]
MRLSIISVVIVLALLNVGQPAEAFGFDFLEELAELLFGSDYSSEEDSSIMVIKRTNGTVDVTCDGCNLTVNCMNCMRIDSNIMSSGMTTLAPGTG